MRIWPSSDVRRVLSFRRELKCLLQYHHLRDVLQVSLDILNLRLDQRWCKWWTDFCSWSVHNPCKINCYITCEWLCSREQDGSSPFTASLLQRLNSSSGHNVCGEKEKKFNRHVHRWSDWWGGNRPSPSVAMPTGRDKSLSKKNRFRSEGLAASTSKPAEGRRGERKARLTVDECECRRLPTPRFRSFEVALFSTRSAEMFLAAQEIKSRSR